MKSITSIFVVILACGSGYGCADLNFHPLLNLRDAVHGEPRINDNVFMMRNRGKADNYADVPSVIPLACLPADQRATDRDIERQMSTMAASDIRTCTYAMKLLIDTRWAHFEHVMNASLSTSNFVADAAITGLTTAVPLVGSGTKDILSAIAAGISGTRKNFDEDILYSYSIQAILQQMRTDRAEIATRIDTRLTGNKPYSGMYEASIDLFEYDQAGSWDHAMSSLQTNIAATTAACQARLRNQQMAAASGEKTVKVFVSTSTDPCSSVVSSTQHAVQLADIKVGAVFVLNDENSDQIKIHDIDAAGNLHYDMKVGGKWPGKLTADTTDNLLPRLVALVPQPAASAKPTTTRQRSRRGAHGSSRT